MNTISTRFEKWWSLAALIVLAYTSLFSADRPQVFTLNCPANQYVSCTDELWDLSIYGNATYTIGYHTYSAGPPTVVYNLNSCNAGTIKRTWTVEDPYWHIHTCTQTIFVSSTGSAPVITWPLDIELEGCNPPTKPENLPTDYNYPTWVDSECAMLGRSYSDMLFTVNANCKKIMRTWKVIDWCKPTYPYGHTTYTHTQVIKIISTQLPTVSCPAELTFNSFNCKNADITVDPLVVPPSSCGGQFEIYNNSPYATTKGANISGTYPIGTTKVTYTIKYGCGNFKFCTTNIVVKNANKPTPYCLGSLITALMPIDTDKDGDIDNGMVELWAKDMDKGSKSLCGYYPLRFSFNKDSIVMKREFTCNHIGKNDVPIYITDSKGAQSYCLTTIIIQNNGANIPDCHPAPPPPPPAPKYVITGQTKSIGDANLSGSKLTLTYVKPIVTYTTKYDTTETLVLDSFINASGYKLYRYIMARTIKETKDSTVTNVKITETSNSFGRFTFDSLPATKEKVKIAGTYADAPRKSINAADVEYLTKFLLGEVTFTSYHNYLAADVDENGVIDIRDQNALMAFVTGSVDSLPGKRQWYLLDAASNYSPASSILTSTLKDFVLLDSIRKDSNIVNFVGIKKGNISVDPGDIQEINPTLRTKVSSLALTMSPNPTTGIINMDVQLTNDENVHFQIISPSGQVLLTQKVNAYKGPNQLSWDISDFYSGLYIYKVMIGSEIKTGIITKI